MFIKVIDNVYYDLADFDVYGKEVMSQEEKRTGKRPTQSNGDMYLIQLSIGSKIWVDAATFQNEIVKEVKEEDVPEDALRILQGGTQ